MPNSVYSEYLDLLCKEIEIIKPKTIITLGNQVISIVLNQNVSVSQCRKQNFFKSIAGKEKYQNQLKKSEEIEKYDEEL